MPDAIKRGFDFEPTFADVDATGAAIDHTSGTVELRLRLCYAGSNTPFLERSTLTSAHREWTSQSGGTGKFLIAKGVTAAFTLHARIRGDVVRIDSGTGKQYMVETFEWTVEDAPGGVPTV